MKTNRQARYGVPVAIIIAGLLVAGAVFWSGGNAPRAGQQANAHQANTREPSDEFRLPSELDHMRGNADAKVTIVEFSDFECPFCARLHPTLSRIVDESDDVKWVYRHFPLSSIHSRALSAATASECIARLGGNEAFWDFADRAFGDQRSLGDSFYKEFADENGIDATEFNSCLKDRSIASEIEADLNEVINIGGRGTPFVVVVTASGKLTSFSGALPYEQVKGLVDQARNN